MISVCIVTKAETRQILGVFSDLGKAMKHIEENTKEEIRSEFSWSGLSWAPRESSFKHFESQRIIEVHQVSE